ncbi:MAG: hypothetical protein E7A62_07860 [Actinomycetaceae bacterium]|nr:hypothetical protein [Actinomycetaceae bacterium]MDU0970892.1 hypothetical protein [Actinomycetaceae bacterium]
MTSPSQENVLPAAAGAGAARRAAGVLEFGVVADFGVTAVRAFGGAGFVVVAFGLAVVVEMEGLGVDCEAALPASEDAVGVLEGVESPASAASAGAANVTVVARASAGTSAIARPQWAR